MAARAKRPSPILGAASAMIGQASESLITKASKFKHTFEVNVDALRPDPGQARKVFEDDEIAALARTLEESGQLQPILVRQVEGEPGRWRIVAGERRWRAAKLVGWPAMVAIEHDGDPEVASLLENLQRVDLSPVEEARGVQRLLEDKGWSQGDAATALGKSRSEVSSTLRILSLPAELLDAVLTSKLVLPKTALAELARIAPGPVRDRLIGLAMEGGLTVRAIRAAQHVEAGRPDAPGSAAGQQQRKTAGHLSIKALDRVTQELRAFKDAGRPVPDEGRAHLEALRREIDRLLSEG